MLYRYLIFFALFIQLVSCSKNSVEYETSKKINPFQVYSEGLNAFQKNDFFFASKQFDKAELNFEKPELAAKSSIMSSYSLYSINFYKEAEESLKRFFNLYPADKNLIYAHYLLAIIYYEQIQDESKDLAPLIQADKQIDFFLKEYPKTDYATDLRFKKDLIQNQLAAKELYIARYYIKIQKWVPAINRLKIIIKKYNQTVFIEEALHRLVEIHYYLGLEEEAKKYASILGYNYDSSEWYQKSYKVLNKDYQIKKEKIIKDKIENEKNLIKKIIGIIK